VEIRPRAATDLDDLVALARDVHATDGYPPRYADDLAALFTRVTPIAAWVATGADGVVGHVALHDRTTRAATEVAVAASCARPEHLVVVARLVVAPRARHRGVARTLLDVAVAEAHTRGRRPFLDVATELDAAVRWYEALGWIRVGTVTATFPDADPLDEHVYLGPPPS
jgi:ribosomal protein S18 acetylase RimI-like enzyme